MAWGGLASESLLYLTAINWFGRGRHMASGFIDASRGDVEFETRPFRAGWASDLGASPSRARALRQR
jgi:hypothetical protein